MVRQIAVEKKGNVHDVPFFFCFFTVLICFWVSPSAIANPSGLVVAPSDVSRLAAHPVWRALLHQLGDQTLIEDESFILSRRHYSAEAELEATLKLFLVADEASARSAVCRYPARYFWLTTQINLPSKINPQIECPGITEFFSKAPADEMAVIFASENLTSPSSMMGHVLLRLSGTNDRSEVSRHAISFFTQVRGFNVPYILWESLVTGKPGYYTLSPYAQKEAFYRQREQRNVWEYVLDLSDDQRLLIQLHLWELRSAKLTYYFHRYNCATLTRFLLALADPKMLEDRGLWTTPLDLVRTLQKSGLVASIDALPSDRWLVEGLSRQLSAKDVNDVKRAVALGQLPARAIDETSDRAYLLLEFSRAWAGFLIEKEPTHAFEAQAFEKSVALRDERYPDQRLDLSRYKNPVLRPQDSQAELGWRSQRGQDVLTLGFLAASHRLEDSSQQSFSESALQLGDVRVEFLAQTLKPRLHELQIYSMTSLTPANAATGGFTGRVRLGAERHYRSDLSDQLAANLSGAYGVTLGLGPHVITYGLAGVGLGYAEGGAYVYGEPEIGVIAEQRRGMKALFSARLLINQLDQADAVTALQFVQTKTLGDSLLLQGGYQYFRTAAAEEHRIELTIKRYF